MLTETEILSTLDNCDEYDAFNFIYLGHPYVYLIDCRLNVFRNNHDKWAIASEILGYNERAWGQALTLEIRFFGNCLIDLDNRGDKARNYYNVLPVDWDSFEEAFDDVNQSLRTGAEFWIVRGTPIALSHNKQDYINAGIELKEVTPNKIEVEEVARLAVQRHGDLFRATNDELYKSIPKDLEKILVIDEWYHKEFFQSKHVFEKGEFISNFDLENEAVRAKLEQEIANERKWNLERWNNRPSSYETWQQIAKVIMTGDASQYNPSFAPNTHWRNWPEGGSM